jgi:fatty-acyl-CoA synthase
LPDFARPRFLRFASEFELGDSYKIKKRRFASEGVDPAALSDPVYLLKNAELVAFDAALYAAVRDGTLRL